MMHHQRTSSPLSATSTTLTEDMYPNLLSSASLCANDESCSIESANLYLKEIVHIQSGCAAGTLSGRNVCDDVLNVSAVVAELRDKIGKAGSDTTQQMDVVTGTSNLVGSLGLATLYTIATLVILQIAAGSDGSVGGGVVPFTPQEVWWSIRDGYATDLVSHYFHNGGLLVGDAVANVRGLSPQELYWSIRDGYVLGVNDGFHDGGVESLPFTPQEVWWAVKDGYTLDMVGHWFRNGGLSV